MLTRRERLERIASAERDRRAGRVELAVAALGDGTEWPARVVLALARLPEDEGEETREILMASMDVWAAETGLSGLDVESTSPSEAETPKGLSAGSQDESDEPDEMGDDVEVWPAHPVEAVDLDSPIDSTELDAAFAVAEAQVDEMHDANRVAERVLMDESVGLADWVGESVGLADWVGESDGGPSANDSREAVGLEADHDLGDDLDHDLDLDLDSDDSEEIIPAVDAAWAARSIWPASDMDEQAAAFDVLADCREVVDPSVSFEATSARPEREENRSGKPSRTVVLGTLERWLANIEKNGARRAR